MTLGYVNLRFGRLNRVATRMVSSRLAGPIPLRLFVDALHDHTIQRKARGLPQYLSAGREPKQTETGGNQEVFLRGVKLCKIAPETND